MQRQHLAPHPLEVARRVELDAPTFALPERRADVQLFVGEDGGVALRHPGGVDRLGQRRGSAAEDGLA